MIKGVIKK
jgi:hypothetical protein